MRSAVPLVACLGLFQGALAADVTSSLAKVADASKPCCQGACPAGQQKYWSIASGLFGGEHCGECCMDPKKYDLFHFFEKNLTKANNTVTPCHDFGYTVYDSTPTHGFGPISMTLDLWNKPKAKEVEAPVHASAASPALEKTEEASQPCCQGACPAGQQKYWSIASGLFGGEHCGECCMDPKKYDLFHFFEKNLTKANNTVTPCHDFGYTVYDSTPTHGFPPVTMTLDLYNKPKAREAVPVGATAPELKAPVRARAAASPMPAKAEEASAPCCQGACPAGQQKYWSIASGLFGGEHCGECCMDPKKYDLFHFFEKNLTKANLTVTPCRDFGYTVYDSTPTHGFPPVTMTLDLYNKPKAREAVTVGAVVPEVKAAVATPVSDASRAPARAEEASTPCCESACPPGQQKYWSIAAGFFGDEHCGECCMDPKKYDLFHFFEKNLTKANNTVTPCRDFGYTVYDSTPTHGFGPVSMTLDLWNKPKAKEVEAAARASAAAPVLAKAEESSKLCCQGACPAGEEKYWSIAAGIFGGAHCGECCMDPKKYDLFHFFEKNLTKSNNTVTPCHDFGYTVYDSTPTHGVWPVTMTLDLYNKPKAREILMV